MAARRWGGHADRAVYDRRQLGYSTDVVYQFCRPSPHSAIVMPSHGRFVRPGNSSVPFHDYKRKHGDRVGLNWRIPNVQGRRSVRHVVFDTNYWKSFAHARLAVPMGDKGCLSLFGDRPDLHRLLAEHLTAEYRVKTEGRGRTVDEWKLARGGGQPLAGLPGGLCRGRLDLGSDLARDRRTIRTETPPDEAFRTAAGDNGYGRQPTGKAWKGRPRPGVPQMWLQTFPGHLHSAAPRRMRPSSSRVPVLWPTHDDIGTGYWIAVGATFFPRRRPARSDGVQNLLFLRIELLLGNQTGIEHPLNLLQSRHRVIVGLCRCLLSARLRALPSCCPADTPPANPIPNPTPPASKPPAAPPPFSAAFSRTSKLRMVTKPVRPPPR